MVNLLNVKFIYIYIKEHQQRIFLMKNKTCMGKVRHRYNTFLDFFLPFKKNINLLSYKYNRDVEFNFELMRYIYIMSIFIFLIFLYFLMMHGFNYQFDDLEEGLFCKYNIPCFLFYSRIKVTEMTGFSITFAIMTFFIMYMATTRWMTYKKLYLNSQLYHKHDSKFSQFFFTSWDWSIKTKPSYLEKKERLRHLYKIGMQEVEIL
jgi:hypothetical protein